MKIVHIIPKDLILSNTTGYKSFWQVYDYIKLNYDAENLDYYGEIWRFVDDEKLSLFLLKYSEYVVCFIDDYKNPQSVIF